MTRRRSRRRPLREHHEAERAVSWCLWRGWEHAPLHSKDGPESSMAPSSSFSHRVTVPVLVTADGTQIFGKGANWHVLSVLSAAA